ALASTVYRPGARPLQTRSPLAFISAPALFLTTTFAVLGETETWISPGSGSGVRHAASSAINAAASSSKTRFKLLLLLGSLGSSVRLDDAGYERAETCFLSPPP